MVDREQFHLISIALNKLKQPMWLVAKALDRVGEDCVSFIKWPTLVERHPHGNFHTDNLLLVKLVPKNLVYLNQVYLTSKEDNNFNHYLTIREKKWT